MWLTDVSIRRPIFIIMFVLALIVMGMQSMKKMPAELNPKIDLPFVTVQTIYAGAGPNEIETLISEPIEKAVTSIGNLRNVTSSSQDGISVVALEFELGTDVDAVAADVRDKVSAIRNSLPDDIEEPTILKVDISSEPVMQIGLEGPKSLSAKEMRILADDVITDRLAKVGGVAGVYVLGGEQREISVAVDKDRLQAYGMGIDKVIMAIRTANLNVPAGSIKENSRDYSVRTVGEFKSADEIRNVRIYQEIKNAPAETQTNQTIRLGDIATITDTVAEAEQLSRMNGRPSVTISIQKQSDANTVSVAEGVKEQLKEMQPILPAGVKPIIATDDSTFVEDSLKDVQKSLFEGIFLVVLIVFLFLHTARATFIVAIAIPTSIMATFMPIASFGFTLNQMTLLALSLVVGILVDDSIVVLENIERHLRMRKSPRQAAIDGRTEIGLAAVTITLVDIVVFVPIAFMGGIVGQFFKQFGVTVAVATGFSLLMSFTLTPMLASRWMKSETDKERDDIATDRRIAEGNSTLKDRIDVFAGRLFGVLERGLKALDGKYRGLLEWALHNRFLVVVIGIVSLLVVFAMPMAPVSNDPKDPRIIIALIALLASAIAMSIDKKSKTVAIVFGVMVAIIALTIHLPFGFGMFPDMDRGQISVSIQTSPGTSLKATDAVVKRVEAILAELPEIQPTSKKVGNLLASHIERQQGYYISSIGTASAGGAFGGSDVGSQYARISIKLVDKGFRHRSSQDVAAEISRKTATIAGAEKIAVTSTSGHGSSGLEEEVQGQNFNDILKQANRLAGIMTSVPGVTDVDISYKESRPERRILVDRVKAAQYDMTVSEVAIAARTAIDGDDTPKLREEGTEYPIRIQYAKINRSAASDVEDLIIRSNDGAPIYLRDVAEVRYDVAPTKIDRKNRQRVVYVTANLAKGANLGNIEQAIKTKLDKSQIITGTSIETGGMGQIMAESFGYMGSAMLLAILLVYMLMGALFESFLTPLVIMFSLPQAMIGALLALLITGNIMSIIGMIGIIMLVGLVTKNAILLVDYTNTLRERGKSRHEAILEAGPTRLRPIMMTTLAMIGGMMPTALALNQGSEMRAPMAIAVIGGMIMSTLLTLVVIPVMYTIVDDTWQKLMRMLTKKHPVNLPEGVMEMEATPAGADPEG